MDPEVSSGVCSECESSTGHCPHHQEERQLAGQQNGPWSAGHAKGLRDGVTASRLFINCLQGNKC